MLIANENDADANSTFEDSVNKSRDLALNLVSTTDSVKPVQVWSETNTLRPYIDEPNSSNIYKDVISRNNQTNNNTCVGEPEYCNFTEAEYLGMLYDYIYPTPGEWFLICCHAIVFLVGSVSFIIFIFAH